MLSKNKFKKLKKYIRDMSQEYIDKDGFVSCELSIHFNDVNLVMDFIDNQNFGTKDTPVVWFAYHCPVCNSRKKDYVHLSIEDVATVYNNSNINKNTLIRRSNSSTVKKIPFYEHTP